MNFENPGASMAKSLTEDAPVSPIAHGHRLSCTEEQERVLSVHHWTENYFSFRTTRDSGLRFLNGQFVMVGLEVDGKLLRRAYSIASANWEEELEFFSIKVDSGALTSRLQHIQVGDYVHVGRKPVGTLLLDDLTPGKTLWLLSTGTGMAPFLSVIKDPETYEQYENVVLVHGVRHVQDLAYKDIISLELPEHEYLGECIRNQLIYAPVVSRDPFERSGRITTLFADGELERSVNLPVIDPEHDRFMLCGGPAMLTDLRDFLDSRGFSTSPHRGEPGDYVFERAFVDR